MTKLFFDHLLEMEEIDKQIKKAAKTKVEQEELWGLVDEIVHHKAMGCILDRLPHEHHQEFLEIFYASPHDEDKIFDYLKAKIGENIEGILRQELGDLTYDLLKEF